MSSLNVRFAQKTDLLNAARLAERPVITKPGHVGRAAVARTSGVCKDGIGGKQGDAEGAKTGLRKTGRGYRKVTSV